MPHTEAKRFSNDVMEGEYDRMCDDCCDGWEEVAVQGCVRSTAFILRPWEDIKG